jgi:hypothetical protein
MWRDSKRTLVACVLLPVWGAAGTAFADRIVMRNLDVRNDVEIVSVDEDGVRIANGQVIGWDEIDRVSADTALQEKANQLLGELGTPLYRIRQRLKVGDYEGLLPYASALYPRYVSRNSRTAYMVKQALMWALLAVGRREEAVAPYLGCYDYLTGMKGRPVNLPGERSLKFDQRTGMTPELPPVWFDPEAARKAVPDVLNAAKAMKSELPPAARIYYASLAATAGDPAGAGRALAGIADDGAGSSQLVSLVQAQAEVLSGKPGPALSRIETSLESLSAANRPVALYWLGMAEVSSNEEARQRAGLLRLLHIPALYGDAAPDLAGAALHQAMETLAALDDAKGSIAVRKELLKRYGHTYYAKQLKTDLDSGADG